ncbi:polysialyltransferase family glycosyltransferase [Mucilaginibacter sp.]
MKHLFYIHSHTTYLTALGVIELKELQPENIIMVRTRNYSSNLTAHNYKQVDLSAEFTLSQSYKYNIFKLNALLRQIDRLIYTLAGESYIAYLPHVGVFLMQVIFTHPLCAGLALLEEGSNAYAKKFQIKQFNYKNWVKETYSKALLLNRYWFTLYGLLHNIKKEYPTEAFGSSAKTFEHLPYKKTIVKWPALTCSYQVKAGAPVFILEGAIENHYATKEIYLNSVKQVVNENAVDVNYIKFHPAQTADNKETIKSYFNALNKELIVLPDDLPFELIILNSIDLRIIGFSSSLLYYARLYGHQVTSYENLLMNDPYYRAYKKLNDVVI